MGKSWNIVLIPALVLGGIVCCIPLGICYATYKAYKFGDKTIEHYMDMREYKKHDFPNLEKNIRRRRALTLPLARPTVTFPIRRRQKTNEQNASPLFTKLPTEVRMMIWEYVLAGQKIKIKAWTGNFKAAEEVEEEIPQHRWAVLKTCRKAYSETIDLLYSRTRFEIDQGYYYTTLFKFRKSILAHRWNEIRFLDLRHSFDPLYNTRRSGCVISSYFSGTILGTEEWPDVCKTLETLPKLRELTITITDTHHWLETEKMAMLKGVKVAGSFQIIVNWHKRQHPDRPLEESIGKFSIITKKKDGQVEDEVEVRRI